MTHTEQYLSETAEIASRIDPVVVESMVQQLVDLRARNGRLFVIGLVVSSANASHLVNDMRKLCDIEAYTPFDNVSEMTARINDEGWNTCIRDWLNPYAKPQDALLVLSVGGGRRDSPVSAPIVTAIAWMREMGGHVWGIVGKDGGVTKDWGHCVGIIPPLYPDRVTPHSESFQAVIWHCIVSHPDLQRNRTKWG